MIEYTQDPAYLAWAERALGVSFKGQPVRWLTSKDRNGSILGVVVFSRSNTWGCEVTVAASTPRFLSREMLQACLAYLFVTCQYRRVTAIVNRKNLKSLSLAQRLGFQIEGVARNWFGDDDACILGLLPQDFYGTNRKSFSWLKELYGEIQNTTAAGSGTGSQTRLEPVLIGQPKPASGA